MRADREVILGQFLIHDFLVNLNFFFFFFSKWGFIDASKQV